MQYLVLLAIAKGGQAFYDTPLLPKAKELACEDPIEALLSAADKQGVKFFLSCDWYGDLARHRNAEPAGSRAAATADAGGDRRAVRAPRELLRLVLGQRSVPDTVLSRAFLEYVRTCSQKRAKLLPKTKTLIAPYNTHLAVSDDRFVRQLTELDVDIVAYQDEVGCLRMTLEQRRGPSPPCARPTTGHHNGTVGRRRDVRLGGSA